MTIKATELTFEQVLKLELVALAEYLQVKDGLSDMQVKMYAAELVSIGPDGLKRAMALLKEDPDVWAGRMPLPAKLKAYVRGDSAVLASEAARRILSMPSVADAYSKLTPDELEIARTYGLKAIVDRASDQTPVIFAQLRDAIKLRLRADRERVVEVGHDRRSDTAALLESREAQEEASEDGTRE